MEAHAHVIPPAGRKGRPPAALAEMLTATDGGEPRDEPDRGTEDDVARKMVSSFDAGDGDQGRDDVRRYADGRVPRRHGEEVRVLMCRAA